MPISPLAIAYLATLAFTGVDASIGYLTNVEGISIVQTILVRTGAVFILALTYLLWTGAADAPFGPLDVRHLLWLRGVQYALGLYLGYLSLRYLTLSDFLTLYCLLPFFTGLLCWIFVNEPFTWTQGVCCCISMAGVILVTDPLERAGSQDGPILAGREMDDGLPTTLGAKLIGVALCLPDVMLQASEVLTMRLIKDRASTVQILTILSICPSSAAALSIAVGVTDLVAPKIAIGWVLLFGIIPLGLIAQYSFTYACSKVSGTQVTIAQYSGVVFGTLTQWLVYGNHPSLTAAVGMALIIGCGVYAALYGTPPTFINEDASDRAEYIPLPTRRSDELDTNLFYVLYHLLTTMSSYMPPTAVAFLSSFAFSCLEADVGYLANILGVPVPEVVLMRNTAVYLLCLAYLSYNRTPDAPLGPRKLIHLNIIGGMGVAISLIMGYTSLHYLTLSEYNTVRCLLPFATAFMCWIFVGERFTSVQAVCCLASVLGVALVTDPFGRPAFGGNDDPAGPVLARAIDDRLPTSLLSKIVGVAICLPAVFGSATEMVIFRIIKGQADTTQMTMYMSLCPAVSAGFLTAATQTKLFAPEGVVGWILLFGVIPLGLTGQYTLTWASQRISGTQVAIAHNSSVVFSALLQWAIYRNHPSWTASIGMIIIAGCGVYAAVYGEDADSSEKAEEGRDEVDMPLLQQQEVRV